VIPKSSTQSFRDIARWIALFSSFDSCLSQGSSRQCKGRQYGGPTSRFCFNQKCMLNILLRLYEFSMSEFRKTPGVYLIIGHHGTTNEWALYPGCSINLADRLPYHARAIKARTNGKIWEGMQHVHKYLGVEGWTVYYRVLATFDETKLHPIWRYLVESMSMSIFRTCDVPGPRQDPKVAACRKFVGRLECHFTGFVDQTTTLNRILPLSSKNSMTDMRNRVCCQCAVKKTTSWYFGKPGSGIDEDDGNEGNALMRYRCDPCYRWKGPNPRGPEEQEILESMLSFEEHLMSRDTGTRAAWWSRNHQPSLPSILPRWTENFSCKVAGMDRR
jgi:hypothetical protein